MDVEPQFEWTESHVRHTRQNVGRRWISCSSHFCHSSLSSSSFLRHSFRNTLREPCLIGIWDGFGWVTLSHLCHPLSTRCTSNAARHASSTRRGHGDGFLKQLTSNAMVTVQADSLCTRSKLASLSWIRVTCQNQFTEIQLEAFSFQHPVSWRDEKPILIHVAICCNHSKFIVTIVGSSCSPLTSGRLQWQHLHPSKELKAMRRLITLKLAW